MTNLNLDTDSGSLAALLAAMDCVVLEMVDYEVHIISAVPPWLDSIEKTFSGAVDIVSILPFLEIFIADAIEFWDQGNPGRLQSDFWSQTNSAGEEVHLLALAAVIDGRKLIVIRAADDLYKERQLWQLYAHQTAMQLKVIEGLKAELEAAAEQLKAANAQLSELSIRDALTGLHNRRHFDQSFELELGRSLRTGEPLSILFMDIDKFKLLNDTYGHSVGDNVLRTVAQVLSETVQRPADVAARFGGEEFAVLLPSTDAMDAHRIATSINATVRALDIPNKNAELEFVTVSLGVYTRQPDGLRTMADILETVDAALYRAKQEGRNRVIVADPKG